MDSKVDEESKPKKEEKEDKKESKEDSKEDSSDKKENDADEKPEKKEEKKDESSEKEEGAKKSSEKDGMEVLKKYFNGKDSKKKTKVFLKFVKLLTDSADGFNMEKAIK